MSKNNMMYDDPDSDCRRKGRPADDESDFNWRATISNLDDELIAEAEELEELRRKAGL